MKENMFFNIPKEVKKEALVKGIKKGGREQDLESGGAFSFKGGPHKDKKRIGEIDRKRKHKGKKYEED